MSRLIRLYPATWRARYETELLELLAERPPTPGDSIDLFRGVIDAYLHPQLTGAAAQPWTHRIPGLLALTAGLLWSSFFMFLAFWADRGQDWGSALGIATLFMFISLPGEYMAAHGRRIAVGIGVAAGAIILGQSLPWSVADGLLNAAAGGVAYLVIGGGMLTLAAIRAGIGVMVRWIILIVSVLIPLVLAIPVLMGVVASGPGPDIMLMFAILLPYGIAWTLVGLRMFVRGAQTLLDLPASELDGSIQAN